MQSLVAASCHQLGKERGECVKIAKKRKGKERKEKERKEKKRKENPNERIDQATAKKYNKIKIKIKIKIK